MQKLRNSNIAKMIAAKITNKEIDFLIYISRFQDDNGKVYGIHYKELCETMHMSYQEFYNVKLSLEEKGFIKCEKSHRIDHDIIHFLRREMLDFTAFPVFFVSNLLLVQRKKYYFNRAMVSRNCSIVL